MKSIAVILSAIAGILVLAGCNPPQVAQGTVVAVDEAEQVLVLRDELPPNAEHEYSVADAKLNVPPAAGDVIRIAYYEEGQRLVATRVMNVSRAAERPQTGERH